MELVAIRPGFHAGRRLRPGDRFQFDENAKVQARDTTTGKLKLDDKGEPLMVKVRVPKWAQPPAEAKRSLAEIKAKEVAGASDTKTVAARAASKAKLDGAQGPV
jgi:hypothetical protein